MVARKLLPSIPSLLLISLQVERVGIFGTTNLPYPVADNTKDYSTYQGYQIHQVSVTARAGSQPTGTSGLKAGQVNLTFKGFRSMARTQEFIVHQGQSLKKQYFKSNKMWEDLEIFKPIHSGNISISTDYLLSIDSLNVEWTVRLTDSFIPTEFPSALGTGQLVSANATTDEFKFSFQKLAQDLTNNAGAAAIAYLTKALLPGLLLEVPPIENAVFSAYSGIDRVPGLSDMHPWRLKNSSIWPSKPRIC